MPGFRCNFRGTGQAYYAMGPPAAHGVSVSAGGPVPVGAHNYQIAAIDANGNTTLPSVAASVTATSGNQTVTITPTLPAGAIGYFPYRDGTKVNHGGLGCSTFTPSSTAIRGCARVCACGNALPTLGTAEGEFADFGGAGGATGAVGGRGIPGYVDRKFYGAAIAAVCGCQRDYSGDRISEYGV